jgi:hypothetical protein
MFTLSVCSFDRLSRGLTFARYGTVTTSYLDRVHSPPATGAPSARSRGFLRRQLGVHGVKEFRSISFFQSSAIESIDDLRQKPPSG